MNTIKVIVLFLAVLLVGQMALRYLSSSNAPRASVTLVSVGDSTPDVALQALNDARAATLKDVSAMGCRLVYFFDPACGACAESAPSWAVAPNGAVVRWIGVTGDAESSQAFLREHGLSQISFITEEEYPSALGIAGVPTVWGTQAGIVRHVASGANATSAEAVPSDWCRE